MKILIIALTLFFPKLLVWNTRWTFLQFVGKTLATDGTTSTARNEKSMRIRFSSLTILQNIFVVFQTQCRSSLLVKIDLFARKQRTKNNLYN